MNHTITYFVCVLILGSSACTQKREPDSKKIAEEQNEQKFDDTSLDDDSEFVTAAADGGMLEVKLGELTQTHATDERVKQFGQQLITDHSKVNTELQTLAQQKNISLPTALSRDTQKIYDDLANKSGADFDQAFVRAMVKDHKDDVDLFQKQADSGNDRDLKSWASEKLPTLRHHLQKAEDLEDSMKR